MKQKIVPVVSVVVGIIAFLMTSQYLRSRLADIEEERREMYKGAAKIRVMAARQNIPAGTAIKADDLGTIQVFESAVRGHAVSPEQAELLFGRKAKFTIKALEPIFWSDIEGGADTGLGLAPLIKPTMRAISLSIGGASAVSGLVQPNDRVDVLGTFSMPSKTAPGEMEAVTLTVLQDVTVLATGQMLAKQQLYTAGRSRSSGYSTITLEVTPREAELLVFAEQVKGRLTLSLRNPSDTSYESDLPEIDFEHLENKLPELNMYRQNEIRHKRIISGK